MYQALYRKYRPSTFDEVSGQDHITSVLKYQTANSKVSHAYLFCGSRGTGKTSCAKILAKAVNCLDPINGNPCNKCDACRAIDSGATTDVLEMDAASNNGVDNVRQIRDEVIYTPSQLKYRVYIIDEVHMLSGSAFNALLKTLEEPPSYVVFILATTEMHKLPSTIISRCQRFDFRRITSEIIADRLEYIANCEQFELDRDAAMVIAKLAQGGMRDAVSLTELCASHRERITASLACNVLGVSGRDSLHALISAISERDYGKIFALMAELNSSSRDISVFWQELIAYYRDMLVVHTIKDACRYLELTESEFAQLKSDASHWSVAQLINHSRLLEEANQSMQRSGNGKRYIAEMALLRLCDTSLDNSSDAMLSRIEALESRMAMLASGGAVSVAAESPTHIKTEPKSLQTPETAVNTEAKEDIKKSTQSKEASGKEFTAWADAVDRILRSNPTMSGMFDGSSAVSDGAGYTIYVKSVFAKTMLSRANGPAVIAAGISLASGQSVSADCIKIEIKDTKPKGGDAMDDLFS